jgi:hypothetical protein
MPVTANQQMGRQLNSQNPGTDARANPNPQQRQTRQQVDLTPVADRAPAVVDIPVRELSGTGWVARFPTSADVDDLASPFRESTASFVAALRAAGANVTISATLRPPERAFLMHWSWKIVNGLADPQSIPVRDGIDIRWDHTDAEGNYDEQQSTSAARAMVNGYGIQNLRVAPSLTSRHIEGNAIDMSISWNDTLTIADASGNAVEIGTTPRTGMNTELHTVGAGYGVTKFHGGDRDKPHWSSDGR